MSKFNKIRKELDSDVPLYGTMTDQEVADELNAVNKNNDRASMTRQEVYSNIEASALSSLTEIQLAHLNLTLADSVNPFDANVVQVFINIFGAQSATIAALNAARVEVVSRSTILGLARVFPAEVNTARAI